MRSRTNTCSQLYGWEQKKAWFFRLSLLAGVMLACVTVAGCDGWYLGYSGCNYYDRPYIENKELRHPVLNQVFVESIFVDIDHPWSDDRHTYRISVNGTLPPGISYYIQNQTVLFEGTAIALGTYPFNVEVDVRYRYDDDYYYDSGYCSYDVSRNFELVVDPL